MPNKFPSLWHDSSASETEKNTREKTGVAAPPSLTRRWYIYKTISYC